VPSYHKGISHAKCLSHKSIQFRNICSKSNNPLLKEMLVNPIIFISVSRTIFSRILAFRKKNLESRKNDKLVPNLNLDYLIIVWHTVHTGIFTKTLHLVSNKSLYNDFYLINVRSQNICFPYIQVHIKLKSV